MIDVAEMGGYDFNQILKLVNEQDLENLEVYLPKSTQLYFSEMNAIADDYAHAAYSGQLLAEISSYFSYDEIGPELHQNIGFKVKVNNVEKLAQTILEISYFYVNEREGEPEELNFELIEEFMDNIETYKLKPACPFFLDVYNDILAQIQNKDETGEENI